MAAMQTRKMYTISPYENLDVRSSRSMANLNTSYLCVRYEPVKLRRLNRRNVYTSFHLHFNSTPFQEQRCPNSEAKDCKPSRKVTGGGSSPASGVQKASSVALQDKLEDIFSSQTSIFNCSMLAGYNGTVIVELNVFSGRPNPIARMVKRPVQRMLASSNLLTQSALPNVLGYRGFTIYDLENATETRFVARGSDISIEHQLLEWSAISIGIQQHCRQKIREALLSKRTGQKQTKRCEQAPSETTYEPSKWNNRGFTRRWNNCYNYGNNIRTNTFAQPGRANNYRIQTMDGPSVQTGAELDGLIQVVATSSCLPEEYNGNLVALVIWPGNDYHFYRLDDNGLFSHKPGRTEARNLDNSGNLITDPRTADRGPYTVFQCFMETDPDVVVIR
ncbi:uncharacterized protein LOC133182644 [Saccostrea echinata]|uniref:uncharacterized protein LOC133182644 n=1 Tax=Saccostrea echinata TaxID=191078 RepID=UPI002A7FCAE4|nr:uncharacterized protein LOC133182644 [Saccostrea echinata]